jgi:hypothetical protein
MVESRFAPAVHGRVELFQTRYRHATVSQDAVYATNRAVNSEPDERGATMLWQLHETLLGALSLSIDLMLKHRSPIVRGLAMLDARVGKRRLRGLDVPGEHAFVRRMFEFRCASEGIDGVAQARTRP